MTELAVQRFEPVYLEIGEIKITEHGKRWVNDWVEGIDRHNQTIKDVATLAISELRDWRWIQRTLDEEGVPQMISSGVSQYAMPALINHLNGKTAYTMPTTCAMALATTAPTSTTTGATVVEANYTGYGRQSIAAGTWNAATAATPSVASNSATITFGNCTAGTSTLLGFILADSASVAAGNSLWYGTLTSTVISTTQTPPTVAAGALQVSMTGT